MRARVMVTENVRSSARRMICRRTSVPGSPRISLTASVSVRPFTAVLSMRPIKSLVRNPAAEAGESSMGDTTFTKPSSMVISMPTPTKEPVVPSRKAFHSFLS